ncbi:Ophiobolin F synthase [Apiospora hydei]|uniref:Ophiobolin F synthase n=1 Tax=Apiospora hydei TaxID=1337664 RepID=A0ABR1X8X4_9PEZI
MEPLSYQSKLVPADEASRTGCFTTLPIRIHPRDDLADTASHRFVRDWAREIGDGREKKTHFSFSPVGNWSSLIYPEAIPERLGVLAYLSDLGLIHDGKSAPTLLPLICVFVDSFVPDKGEGLSIEEAKAENDELHAALDPDDGRCLTPDSRAMKTKKLVSQCILECVNLDHERGLNMLAAFRDVWLAISEKNSDKEAQTIEEYLQYRSENGGMLVFWPMLQFSLAISLSEADRKLAQPMIDAATEGLLLANDYFSWERECRELESGHSQRIVSAVELFIRTEGLSPEAAKDEVKRRIIKSESDFCQRRDELYRAQPGTPEKLRRWIDCAGLAVSGNHYWCSACPRQNAWKNETLTNGTNTMNISHGTNGVHGGNGTNGNGPKRALSPITEDDIPTKKRRNSYDVSSYPLLHIQHALQRRPRRPHRRPQHLAPRPPAAIQRITSVVNTLHNASLILDDLQDNSPLRRGLPAAHVIFGPAQSINSATFMFVRAVGQVAHGLSPAALTAVLEELEGLYLGQSWDLYWKHNLVCPSEAEYVNMVDHKTGGMFRMLLRMLQAESGTTTGRRLHKLHHR